MRYIIGIIVGIIIVLNWGNIREFFDAKLNQAPAAEAAAPATAQPAPPPSEPEDIVAKGMSDAAADQSAR